MDGTIDLQLSQNSELVQGISGQTWTYIGIGITAFLILLVVIFGCLCGRMIRAKRGNEGVVVTTYPQQNAMLNVVNTVPDAQMEKGISNAAYTGQPQVVNTPYVYTVQQQNPSVTPSAQPMKSSGFGYNGSYKMNQHYYAQAQKHKPVRASRKFAL
ncbi:hypothetical protein MAR_008261 [Mya arenaria]|uniref:Uncharacterized protein n=1 Tax=Mya arenaria TaxID=6604 RepID=A0ABY7DYL5_MYAAR|nr:hypothetical protein MAR_008261 [Mya arenaria]